jgi:hypothetical protein
MPKKKIPEFSGKLNQPISVKNLGSVTKLPRAPTIIGGQKAAEKYQQDLERYLLLSSMEAAKQAIEKIPLLLKKYDIPDDNLAKWEILSLRLAIDCVPGFSLASPKSKGAKKKWHDGHLAALYLDVHDRCKDKTKINLAKMFHELSKKEPWKKLCNPRKSNDSKGSGKRLHNIYNDAMSGNFGKLIEWLDDLPVANPQKSKRDLLEIMAGK